MNIFEIQKKKKKQVLNNIVYYTMAEVTLRHADMFDYSCMYILYTISWVQEPEVSELIIFEKVLFNSLWVTFWD